MAKGDQKSNREARKPKKEKPKAPVGISSFKPEQNMKNTALFGGAKKK